jgi:CRP/FNR family transcriptional regulator, cyclic AMP receptor protein
LAREGDRERGFFVIVSGGAEARRGETLLATLAPGDFFGEMAVLERDVQVATVTTTAPTRVLAMTGVSFETMTETMPSITARMLIAMARRIRTLEDRYLPLAEQVRRTPTLPAADERHTIKARP